jgi:hypothetical protein
VLPPRVAENGTRREDTMLTQTTKPHAHPHHREAPDPLVYEMLSHDVYDLPMEGEDGMTCLSSSGQVLCIYCGQIGESVDGIPHEPWCVYINGPVCQDVPN